MLGLKVEVVGTLRLPRLCETMRFIVWHRKGYLVRVIGIGKIKVVPPTEIVGIRIRVIA